MQNIDWVNRYLNDGFCFFNTGSSEKKIKTNWTKFQTTRPTKFEILNWLKWATQNYAIVCGEISNIVVFDVDTKNGGDPTPFLNRGLFEIRTPSGGYHFYTTYNPILASTKHKKSKHDGILFAVDVQSNGSLVFAPPSTFSNGTYTITNDVPITPLPDDLLIQVLDALQPEKESTEFTPFQPIQNPEMGRPGDIFNALASWNDVLIPLGWVHVGGRQGSTQYWRRPGKKEGISATTNYKDYDLLFPFTSSTELEPMKGYTKFNALATLKYGGNYRETAKALVMENYKKANLLI